MRNVEISTQPSAQSLLIYKVHSRLEKMNVTLSVTLSLLLFSLINLSSLFSPSLLHKQFGHLHISHCLPDKHKTALYTGSK